MINQQKIILAISICSLSLCSCADKEPTFGDKLMLRGDEVHTIGEHWSEGENLTKEGRELILAGRKDINAGNSLISEGKSKITKGDASIINGNQLERKAEKEYKSSVKHPVLGFTKPPSSSQRP
jgi:hypothetical protein